jgi:hypothetical protein
MSLEILTPAEVGAALKERSADWVARQVNAGGFEHLRVGGSMRFTLEQAEAFIASFKVGAGGEAVAETDPMRSQTSRSRNRRKSTAA